MTSLSPVPGTPILSTRDDRAVPPEITGELEREDSPSGKVGDEEQEPSHNPGRSCRQAGAEHPHGGETQDAVDQHEVPGEVHQARPPWTGRAGLPAT